MTISRLPPTPTTRRAPRRRRPVPGRRSPAAEKQAAYRARLRDGTVLVSVPVTRRVIDYLDRERLFPQGRDTVARSEIGAAIAAALDRLARSR